MEDNKIQTLHNVVFLKSSIQSKITYYLKRTENVTHNWKKNWALETNPEITEIGQFLANKDFKTAIVNIFKEKYEHNEARY